MILRRFVRQTGPGSVLFINPLLVLEASTVEVRDALPPTWSPHFFVVLDQIRAHRVLLIPATSTPRPLTERGASLLAVPQHDKTGSPAWVVPDTTLLIAHWWTVTYADLLDAARADWTLDTGFRNQLRNPWKYLSMARALEDRPVRWRFPGDAE